jgi:hypothetical protein
MNDACFIVCNKNGQALGYFYFEDDRGDGLLLDLLDLD